MSANLPPASIDKLGAVIQRGDRLIWGQATGEPEAITRAIVANRHAWGPLSVFVGATFTDTLSPSTCDGLGISSYGAIGTTRALAETGALDILPVHASQIGRAIERGDIGCDVAIVQLSPPGPNGRHSLGPSGDYLPEAMRRARVVIAEVNSAVPWTFGTEVEGLERVALWVETHRPPVAAPAHPPSDIDRAIARHVADVIDDGVTLQVGIGATIDALLHSLSDRRDLGIHSGMIGDGMLGLLRAGVVTNARKAIDRGKSVVGGLFGGSALLAHADRNPDLVVRPYAYTHAAAVLAQLDNLVAINGAVEVDITGAVNAETVGGRYVGGVGGQVDYMHAAARARHGRSVAILPATAAGGRISRITMAVETVTTARSDVDCVVTEYGRADLRGQPLRERIRRMIAIAHPDFREELDRAGHERLRRGY